MTNTTGSSPSSTKAKTFKRGRWIKVTKGPYAGTKRWLSAESRTKLSANTTKCRPWDKKNRPATGKKITAPSAPGPTENVGTGTTVRLSQETASKISSRTEGLTLDEAVEFIITHFFDGRDPKQKIRKAIALDSQE